MYIYKKLFLACFDMNIMTLISTHYCTYYQSGSIPALKLKRRPGFIMGVTFNMRFQSIPLPVDLKTRKSTGTSCQIEIHFFYPNYQISPEM